MILTMTTSNSHHNNNYLNGDRLNIAINGFGRIGRNVLRVFLQYQQDYPNINIVAINDIADPATLLHLLKYDSTHGRLTDFGITASVNNTTLTLQHNSQSFDVALFNQPNPSDLPWQALSVDVVLECTGHFRQYTSAYRHIEAGAKQVIIGAAPFDTIDQCVVMGVNSNQLHQNHPIISSVSCTTQALVPLLWLIDNHFGVKSAMLTEIHAVTTDQNVLDAPHRDLRRARASGHNIIPTTSSSIAATLHILPSLQGKLSGYSVRVPTINVAMIDVTLTLTAPSDLPTLKQVLKTATIGQLRGIMDYTDEPLVSSDFIHNRHSLIVDGGQLYQAGEQFKLIAWYDNEWGYANRLLGMCQQLATQNPV